ncbi:MAG: 2-oxoacid:acceptor oxidoreductase family protein [Actinomycetota bacterium]|nr:2-oxoacid:acceptor oxidoreductase family protein [Actinomycetota bacterium]MDK1038750.1 2-oxoacid:acceptor oxidoreductase family protein [Actinomycetota bacterium]MDK1095835.1 2-oxoacid:acceptor oxidoreductase family protein [Actinomycetota bacterium]MDK1103197.1 2-oxoacid:acceptor oxidoreductase family protein [Actinomycetota bacterium]
MSRSEIRIAGAGGQGVVTAGRILAEAAILSGSRATHSQVYGPQSRGGASRSDVVIADETIGFPLADSIDVLVVLSAEAYARYEPELRADGSLIVDARCAPDSLNGSASRFPVVDTARAVSGGQLVTGVVALGVLQAHTGVVDADALKKAVAARVPAQHRDMNLEALAAGMELVGGGES